MQKELDALQKLHCCRMFYLCEDLQLFDVHTNIGKKLSVQKLRGKGDIHIVWYLP